MTATEAEPGAPHQQQPARRNHGTIGKRPIRHDGYDKVTGRAQFGADLFLPDMLYGAILRSPHAHARIISLDTRAAQALPGVKAVVTARDLPPVTGDDPGLRHKRDNILARGKVLYYGQALAAVAATTLHAAEEALALIQVDYERLSPRLHIRDVVKDDALPLGQGLRKDGTSYNKQAAPKTVGHVHHERGDPAKGFAQAAAIVEREFTTATVHQGYIEPQSATAHYHAGGQLTIWCSNQSHFDVRGQVSELLQIPTSAIRVVPMEIGGGFGGKYLVYLEPVATLLSKKSGHRPVKMVMSRADVFMGTGPAAGATIRVKMGADAQGRLTAAEAHLLYEAGAFPGSSVASGAGTLFAPYRVDNLSIDGYGVLVNKPNTFDYRGSTAAIAVAAAEQVVDELSEALRIDPLAFRALNGVKEGDRRPTGSIHPRIGYLETVAAARKHPHYTAPLAGPNRGRGVASAVFGSWDGGTSSARASLNANGTVDLAMGSVDLSGTRTTVSMQLAEALDIAVANVNPLVTDTDSLDYTDGSYGSRTTVMTGWAAYKLGLELKNKLVQHAAKLWRVDPAQIAFADGCFATGERRMTLAELAARLEENGDHVAATATVSSKGVGPGSAVHIVDVEVDPETGKVDILRYTALQDVGKAIHPSYVEGQLQGAVAQGVGWALTEEYIYDDEGHLLNADFLDYRMPTCPDLPVIDTVLLEVPNPDHPFGARGAGEVSILPPIAAIANAIYQAVGLRPSELPMSPRRVLELLMKQEEEDGRSLAPR
jgi:CO/xanthine dehydrogenase Mo-binding subunit